MPLTPYLIDKCLALRSSLLNSLEVHVPNDICVIILVLEWQLCLGVLFIQQHMIV